MNKKYWLVKTEPTVFSIDDLARDRRTLWTDIRNYQARNFLREMDIKDPVLIYHSSADPAGIVGIGTVTKKAIADPTQFDKKSDYYDPKSTKEAPRWFAPELSFREKFKEILELSFLRTVKELAGLELLKRGSRLSVHPVTEKEFDKVISLSRQ